MEGKKFMKISNKQLPKKNCWHQLFPIDIARICEYEFVSGGVKSRQDVTKNYQ
jgi:hypothetical protein